MKLGNIVTVKNQFLLCWLNFGSVNLSKIACYKNQVPFYIKQTVVSVACLLFKNVKAWSKWIFLVHCRSRIRENNFTRVCLSSNFVKQARKFSTFYYFSRRGEVERILPIYVANGKNPRRVLIPRVFPQSIPRLKNRRGITGFPRFPKNRRGTAEKAREFPVPVIRGPAVTKFSAFFPRDFAEKFCRTPYNIAEKF